MSWLSTTTSIGTALAADGSGGFWFPPQASTNASLVDNVYYFIYWVSVISFVLIILTMVHFVRKYARTKPTDMPKEQSDHNTLLEIGWSVPVAIVSVILFYFGAIGYIDAKTPADDAYEIKVTGWKWAWSFTYPNGESSNELHLPENTPIRLVMTSDDVLHSFFIPAFRIKQDVVPGRYTDINFTPEKSGEFQIFCTEYCGTQHSQMLAKAFVHPVEDFEEWIDGLGGYPEENTPAENGALVYEQQGCNACHLVDGNKLVGPSFKGLWGAKREFADGSSTTADENYIKNSILNPKSQIVAGYQPVMPTYQGKISDEEIEYLIAYFKTLK